MEKKWMIVGIIALFIAVVATSYYVSSRQHSVDFLSEADLSNPDLLTDTAAILYFSTTADQDMNRDGLSFAVFVDIGRENEAMGNGRSRAWDCLMPQRILFFLEDRGHVYLADFGRDHNFFHGDRRTYR